MESRQCQLAFNANRVSSKEYIVSLINTRLQEQTFNLTSHIGPIASVEEILLSDATLNGVPGWVRGFLARPSPYAASVLLQCFNASMLTECVKQYGKPLG